MVEEPRLEERALQQAVICKACWSILARHHAEVTGGLATDCLEHSNNRRNESAGKRKVEGVTQCRHAGAPAELQQQLRAQAVQSCTEGRLVLRQQRLHL